MALRILWFLVAIVYGYLAMLGYSRMKHPAPKPTQSKGLQYVATAPELDDKNKTLPLGKKFPDKIEACFTQAAAIQVAEAAAKGDEAAALIFVGSYCVSGIFLVTYVRQVHQAKGTNATLNVFEVKIGSVTVWTITDWTARKDGLDI